MAGPIDDEGYIEAATRQGEAMRGHAAVDVLLQTALALWKRSASSSISDMQTEIGKRQVALAEEIAAHARNFWPYEKAAVEDAFGIGKATAQYDALSLSWAAMADADQQVYYNRLNETLSDRCLKPSGCERSIWKRNRQMDRSNIISFADRQAEGRMDKLNDIRYAKQYAALALGRDHLVNVPTFMSLGGAARGTAASALIGTINSAFEAYGYYRRGTDNWGSELESRWGKQGISYAVVPKDMPERLADAFAGGYEE